MTDRKLKELIDNTINVYGAICVIELVDNKLVNKNRFTGSLHPFFNSGYDINISNSQKTFLRKSFKDSLKLD